MGHGSNATSILEGWQNRLPLSRCRRYWIQEQPWQAERMLFFDKRHEHGLAIGADYFEETLLDYDVHSNYVNWINGAGMTGGEVLFVLWVYCHTEIE